MPDYCPLRHDKAAMRCHSRTRLLLITFVQVQMIIAPLKAQYMDNSEHSYMAPYMRHKQPTGNRQQSSNLALKNIQPNEDMASSQSLFMIDFKRQAILTQEPEKGSKANSDHSNHTLIEKYIIDSNSQEYPLVHKVVTVEKRPPYFLPNQAMASSKSSVISKADSELDYSNEKEKIGVLTNKHGHKFIQVPFDSANYHQLISSKVLNNDQKLSIDSDKKNGNFEKENIKYTIMPDDKVHMFDERFRAGNGTDEKILRNMQMQLRLSLENFLTQLNDLKLVTEHEIKKLSFDDSRKSSEPEVHYSPNKNEKVDVKGHQFYTKDYDSDLRHYLSMSKIAKFDSS